MGKKKGKRRQARENALCILYEGDIRDIDNPELLLTELTYFDKQYINQMPNEELMNTLVFGVIQKKEVLDRIIEKFLENWTIERIALIDKIILRIAIYEMVFMNDASSSIIIDEAIDIAKEFGDKNSYMFINGILDAVNQNIERIRTDFQ